jgi:hypothetical protein
VIHLIGLQVVEEMGELFTVGQIAIMEEEAGSGVVGIFIDMIDAMRI